jgi:serine/threonine-protein kinase
MRDPLLGRTLGGKFTLESLIGTGAMGAVYRARHIALDAVVAVKVMHDDIAVDQMFAERFHREARAASRLDHPNVIRVIDFGIEPDGSLYIVMEYVEGIDLYQLIRQESPLPEARIADLMAQVLSGVAAAHAMGVIHRDLKPENIMVTSRIGDDGSRYDLVKVCDFGIAQLTEGPQREGRSKPERTLTARGVLLGTPQYMSPEQARGETIDARTDVYSLGVILYQLLTGQLPFDAPSPIDIVLKHISEEPLPPRELVPSASARLEAVCLKALAKRREGRWASAREMRAALRSEPASTPRGFSPPSLRGFAVPSTLPRVPDAPTGLMLRTGDVEAPVSFRRGFGKKQRAVYGALIFGALLLAGIIFATGRDDPDGQKEPMPRSLPSIPAPAERPRPTESEPAPTTTNAATDVAPTASARAGKTASSRRGAAKGEPGSGGASIAAEAANTAAKSSASSEMHAASAALEAVHPEPTASGGSPKTAEAPRPSSVASSGPSASRPSSPFEVRTGALRVKWRVAQVGGGTTAGDVARALSRVAGGWRACYERGLRTRGQRVEGQGMLRLSCDDQGRVVNALLPGTGMSDVAECVQSSVTGITIPNADTGEAWATVSVALAIAD